LKDSMSTPLAWYLIRTKPSSEQYVHEELWRVLPEVFLPMSAVENLSMRSLTRKIAQQTNADQVWRNHNNLAGACRRTYVISQGRAKTGLPA
jgi:hypothetical protein